MAATSWNDAEDRALQGLRPRTQLIYLRAIRRYMDYETGVVGLRRAVNYASMIEVCDHLPDAGSNKREEPLTKHGAIAAVAEMERAGLVVKRASADPRRLVFFLPLADRDRSVQKGNRTGTAHPEHDSEPHTKNHGVARVSEEGAAQGTAHEPHRVNRTHPVSGEDHFVDTVVGVESDQRAREHGRFSMRPDWEPGRDELWAHLKLTGVPRETCTPEFVQDQLGEFRSYRMATDERWTESQWVQKLAAQMKRAWRKSQEASNAARGNLGRGSQKRRDFIGEDIEALRRGAQIGGGDGYVPDGSST